ncbi:response regulator [Halomonas sp. TRM85114]|uniref:ATP-binding protein n=1 Tax=Halomonas jincaotanensis TaxID=2810616 RepID=UPI001BD68F9B|nr:ATP-binding protein [Halomonas jincaotanensis]MBS9403590.1 response regulator [Halomonas jincaotanensis]
MNVDTETQIHEMQRRIRHWLDEDTGAGVEGTLEGLTADVTTLEEELQALFPAKDSTRDIFAALREQAIFRTVLESVVEGVVVADMQGRLLVFNSTARELLGKGPIEVDPESWSELYGFFYSDGSTSCPSDELPLTRAMQGEAVDGEELVVRTPGRPEDVHILATARPLTDNEGEQIGGVVVFHDITQAKTVERELRLARNDAESASRAKSEFLANMSHEIRTPLTAVLGFADLLMDADLNESNKLNYIQAIRRNGHHLLGLINDVLDLSKLQAEKMIVETIDCSLHQLLHEVASIMQVRAHEKGLTFEVEYATPIPRHVQSDPMRIRQILLNLLSNAIKFTPGGAVRLTASCLDPGRDTSRVELAVKDSGIGLNEVEIDSLFQPFQQANPSTTRQFGGTGLGLTICRSLAEALGGEIRVESSPGSGSTFTFVFHQPIDAQAEMVTEHCLALDALREEPTRSDSSPSLYGRILLAEDGIDNQLLISTILRRQGLVVEVAENGEIAVNEALEALANHKAYDVILMDMQMPRLDGYGATAKLRRKGYAGPIVALTAHAMAGERERCLAAGCDDYLTKPIERAVLLGAVESHLRRIRGEETPSMTEAAAVTDKTEEAAGPLYSDFADDPEMDELIAGFIERLSATLEDIQAALKADDMERLQRLAHQLKGAAGGYGFMPVSRDAEALEMVVRNEAPPIELTAAMERLAFTCSRLCHDDVQESSDDT